MPNYENDFFKWFKDFLKKKGLQFSRCGFKLGDSLGSRHDIETSTGYWSEPNYSVTKPPRWLMHMESTGGGDWSAVNPAGGALNIGAINSAQADKAGVVFRITPIIQLSSTNYHRADELEVHAFFAFHGSTPRGSSSEPFNFDPDTGRLVFKGEHLPYIAAGLIGIKDRSEGVSIANGEGSIGITYGEVLDALTRAIITEPMNGNAGPILVYDLIHPSELERLKKDISGAWTLAGPLPGTAQSAAGAEEIDGDDDEIVVPATLEIPEDTDLIGIDPAVYRQINAALASGKQHIMLYGPPGTGKTSLARHIATTVTGGKWTLVTGSADWSSQDIIGGYQPVGAGKVAFIPGVLLKDFDRPLIIDELNRCDIDKVIGPLFTVLSGQETTLPYRVESEQKDSQQYVILPEPKQSPAEHEFAPGPQWRLIATINSIDKAALYQMSYALTRRFGWVYVDAPQNLHAFIADFLCKEDPTMEPPEEGSPCPLGDYWRAINEVRVLGPAPIIDALKAIETMIDGADFFAVPDDEMKIALLDAVDMVLVPMLDGIMIQDAETLAEAAIKAFDLSGNQADQIRRRHLALAV